jgi:acylphosphatase
MSRSQRISLDWPRMRRCRITVDGVVQGIGLRPSVYRLAVRHGVAGSVCNSRAGVLIDAEGDDASLESFLSVLNDDAPGHVSVAWVEPEGLAGFSIAVSAHDGVARFSSVPDAPCATSASLSWPIPTIGDTDMPCRPVRPVAHDLRSSGRCLTTASGRR